MGVSTWIHRDDTYLKMTITCCFDKLPYAGYFQPHIHVFINFTHNQISYTRIMYENKKVWIILAMKIL